jgi:hypothetical protein
MVRQGARDRHTLLLAAGEMAARPRPLRAETDGIEQFSRAIEHLLLDFFPSLRIGIITFSSAVKSSSRKWNWKMKPINSLRRRDSSSSGKSETASERIETVPASGLSSNPRM